MELPSKNKEDDYIKKIANKVLNKIKNKK